MTYDPLKARPEDEPETRKVLRAFVADGRITAMPARAGRRHLLLERVVRLFEPGRKYDETEVNEILLGLYDDYVALRRYLVDAQLLERENGVYWRIGGQVDLSDPGAEGRP